MPIYIRKMQYSENVGDFVAVATTPELSMT
jgi:hypothetical protein